jgi:peptidoglycan-associated lipoprotein
MGYLVEILGTLTIVETDKKMSKAIVQESYSDIPLGSLLTPYKKTQNPTLTQKPKENMSLEGYIIATKGNKFAGSMSDLVYADIGRNHNVSPGDRFEAYITPKNETNMWNKMDPYVVPMMPHVIGRLQVLAVEDETSTMFVEQNHDAVEVGQKIRYKPVKGVTPLPDIAALTEAPTYVMDEPQMREESITDDAGSAGDSDDDEIAEPFPFAGAGGGAEGGVGSGGADGTGGVDGAGSGTDSGGLQQGQIVAEDAKLMEFHTTTHLKDVHFKFDRFDFDEASIAILKNNAQYLKQNPAIRVQIQGHSDERGTNNYNLALGERRSTSIKNFLVSQGVEENRMYVLSYGEEKPFCSENTDVCWEQNRRAHFRVTGDGE